ncbi:hypothetical protein WA158_002891 [Blastocystis sp. Blastoise]
MEEDIKNEKIIHRDFEARLVRMNMDNNNKRENVLFDEIEYPKHRRKGVGKKSLKSEQSMPNGEWNKKENLPVILQKWCNSEGYLNNSVLQRKIYTKEFNSVIETEVAQRAQQLVNKLIQDPDYTYKITKNSVYKPSSPQYVVWSPQMDLDLFNSMLDFMYQSNTWKQNKKLNWSSIARNFFLRSKDISDKHNSKKEPDLLDLRKLGTKLNSRFTRCVYGNTKDPCTPEEKEAILYLYYNGYSYASTSFYLNRRSADWVHGMIRKFNPKIKPMSEEEVVEFNEDIDIDIDIPEKEKKINTIKKSLMRKYSPVTSVNESESFYSDSTLSSTKGSKQSTYKHEPLYLSKNNRMMSDSFYTRSNSNNNIQLETSSLSLSSESIPYSNNMFTTNISLEDNKQQSILSSTNKTTNPVSSLSKKLESVQSNPNLTLSNNNKSSSNNRSTIISLRIRRPLSSNTSSPFTHNSNPLTSNNIPSIISSSPSIPPPIISITDSTTTHNHNIVSSSSHSSSINSNTLDSANTSKNGSPYVDFNLFNSYHITTYNPEDMSVLQQSLVEPSINKNSCSTIAYIHGNPINIFNEDQQSSTYSSLNTSLETSQINKNNSTINDNSINNLNTSSISPPIGINNIIINDQEPSLCEPICNNINPVIDTTNKNNTDIDSTHIINNNVLSLQNSEIIKDEIKTYTKDTLNTIKNDDDKSIESFGEHTKTSSNNTDSFSSHSVYDTHSIDIDINESCSPMELENKSNIQEEEEENLISDTLVDFNSKEEKQHFLPDTFPTLNKKENTSNDSQMIIQIPIDINEINDIESSSSNIGFLKTPSIDSLSSLNSNKDQSSIQEKSIDLDLSTNHNTSEPEKTKE